MRYAIIQTGGKPGKACFPQLREAKRQRGDEANSTMEAEIQ